MPLLYIYIGCMVLGGTLVMVLLSSRRAGAPIDLDVTGSDPVSQRGITKTIKKILNLRNFAFFTAFFGLTGTVLTLLDIPRVITLIAAHGMGFFGSRVVSRLFTTIKDRSEELKR
ncbi:MAG: hypothetical protein AB9866_00705 [Syntrophobacteraceae bacterium]